MKFDIIVSNPPYIATKDLSKLQKEVGFEPRSALDAGTDGLNCYPKILNKASLFLKRNGFLILEIGFCQLKELKKKFFIKLEM